jgi:hypothetical protein
MLQSYYQKNRNKLIQRSRIYRLQNKEKKLEENRKYRQKPGIKERFNKLAREKRNKKPEIIQKKEYRNIARFFRNIDKKIREISKREELNKLAHKRYRYINKPEIIQKKEYRNIARFFRNIDKKIREISKREELNKLAHKRYINKPEVVAKKEYRNIARFFRNIEIEDIEKRILKNEKNRIKYDKKHNIVGRRERREYKNINKFFNNIELNIRKKYALERRRYMNRLYSQKSEAKEKKRLADRLYKQKPEVKEKKRIRDKLYRQKPEVKERKRIRDKLYRQKPKVKEKFKEKQKIWRNNNKERISRYMKKPSVKAYMKRYRTRPEIKKRLKEYYKGYCINGYLKEYVKKYRKRPGVREKIKNEELKRLYNLNLIERNIILIEQDKKCKICGSNLDDGGKIDHNHETGKVRGILCSSCNCGLGFFRDNWKNVLKSSVYLFSDYEPNKNLTNEIYKIYLKDNLLNNPPNIYSKPKIKIVEKQKMIFNQNNKCLICSDLFKNTRKIHADHNHKTGKIRGILCFHCNTGLGFFRDNWKICMRAAIYLFLDIKRDENFIKELLNMHN